MKTIIYKLSLAVSLLAFISCENMEVIVPIEVDDVDPILAVGAHFSNDMDAYRIAVSQAVGVFSEDENTVQEGVDISIWQDGEVFSQFEYNLGEPFTFNEEFLPGKTYRMEASKEGFETVFAEDVYPTKVEIDTAYIGEIYWAEDNFSGQLGVQLSFQDPPGRDFYEVKVFSLTQQGNFSSRFPLEPLDDLILGQAGFSEGVFISDEEFDGELIDLELNFNTLGWSGDTELMLELRHVNEAYFQYDVSIELAKEAESNPFSEPVQIKSNVENGMGVFALWNTDVSFMMP